jgi:hypothetical protein
MIRLFILFLTLISLPIFPQAGPTSNWYFGNLAGLTFNSGSPVALTNGALVTTEGVATISDNSGNLLFYTNGITVWNRNHVVMSNGTGLLSDQSSTQSAIIVQKPLSNNIYYIFCSDNDAGPNGITYSEVDMTLSGGLGAITANKNISLYAPSCEKLCAVRNCNNQDIWVISKDWNSAVFRCWSVNTLGVGSIQSWSIAGSIPNGPTQSSYGQLKASPDGRKLAACYYGSPATGGLNRVEIYDFNPTTGFVTNSQLISTESGAYGCEFSPNGRVLYVGCNQGALLQWNICAGTLAQIQASRYVVANNGPFIGSLQIGPDGKIYVARNNTSLSVINNPNSLGVACGYSNLSVSLSGASSRMGLPNFASYYTPQIATISSNQINCDTYQFSAPILNNNCSLQNLSYIWNFGDGTQSTLQSPQHQFPNGTWNVTVTINTGCVPITGNMTLTINNGVNTGPIYKQ